MSNAIAIPHIYIINLESRPDRLERMRRRLQYHNLLSHSTIIKAVTTTDPVVEEYYGKAIDINYRKSQANYATIRSHIACFASHLKALRQMIADNHEEAIILEDDAMLHNNFITKYQQCRANANFAISVKSQITTIMLFYNIRGLNGVEALCNYANKIGAWDGKNPKEKNLIRMFHDNIDLTTGYVISRKYAAECLIKYDKPFIEYEEQDKYIITSEFITKYSKGLLVHPALVIEEPMVNSDMRVDDTCGEITSECYGWNEYTAAETPSWRALLEGRRLNKAEKHVEAFAILSTIKLDELSSFHKYIFFNIALVSYWYANKHNEGKELVYTLQKLYKNNVELRKLVTANDIRILRNMRYFVGDIELIK